MVSRDQSWAIQWKMTFESDRRSTLVKECQHQRKSSFEIIWIC